MSERTIIILKITGFITITLMLVWAVWAVFFRTPGTSVVPGKTAPQAPAGQLPTNTEGQSGEVVQPTGPTTLVPEVNAPAGQTQPDTIASGGRTTVETLSTDRATFKKQSNAGFNYYDVATEQFYRISENGGEPIPLSSERFLQVQNVTWSNSGTGAVVEFPDGSNIYTNFTTGTRATLPREAREFSFAPSEKEIAYEYFGQSANDRYIVTSNVNGQGQQIISPIGNESINVAINWSPDNQIVATFRKPTSGSGEEVFFIGRNDENYLSLQTNGLGFEGAWSPTGEQILYSVYNEQSNYNPVLHIAGAKGETIGLNNRSLRLQTWPDKCVFENETTLYCAVPRVLEQGSGIFPELSSNTSDSIYKIDLTNNTTAPIAFPESSTNSSFVVTGMDISSDGDELFFTDLVSGQIHRLQLR